VSCVTDWIRRAGAAVWTHLRPRRPPARHLPTLQLDDGRRRRLEREQLVDQVEHLARRARRRGGRRRG